MAGAIMCFTPLAPIGAGMLGAGIGGLVCGFISEKIGGSYAVGWIIGNIVGSLLGTYAYKGVQALRTSSARNAGCNAKLASAECFIAGTLILCKDEDGNECHKAIEDIKVGDLVYAYDEETGESDWKPVVRLFRNESSNKTSVKIKAEDGKIDEIVSTPGHKYYLPDNKVNRNADEKLEHASYKGLSDKWVSAEDLKRGDRVLLSDGKYGIVKSVKTENCEKFITYNFEVEDFHTYYVGEQGILVHNNQCRLDPKDIRYTQNNGRKTFTDGAHAGESVDDLISALKNGTVTPDDIPPLEVFKAKGEIWSINNRRLYAYKMAGVDSVPVKWVERSAMRHLWTGDGINFYLRR